MTLPLKSMQSKVPDTYSKINKLELPPPKQNTPKKKTCFDERTIISKSENYSNVSYRSESWEDPAEKKHKPKLLQQLEFFLEKELYLLGVSNHDVNDISLQAHQEAFEYLIDNFKTYKSILSSIKNSYEVTLSKLRSQLRELDLMKQMVVTTAEKYEKKIMDVYEDKKQELVLMEEQHIRLQKNVQSLLEHKRDIEYILGRLKEEVDDIHEKYDQQRSRHKMLVTEINHLLAQQQFTMKQIMKRRSSDGAPPEVQEDPVALKNAVKEAKLKERTASKMYSQMNANYCDVLPRKDYDSFKKKYDEEMTTYEDLLNTYKLFGSEHGILLKMNQNLTEERNHYYQQQQKLQSISGAIQHWKKCVGYITGEDVSWQEISSEAASRELLQVLIQTISAKEAAHLEMDITSFTGKGLSPDVPKLLRYEGKVNNRRMTPRDCVYFIKDIWSNRVYEEESNLMEFLEAYMMKQFPDETLRTEWSYTFYFTLKQLSPINNYVKLFWKILNEEIEESVHHCQEIFTRTLEGHCRTNRRPEAKYISKAEFHILLEEFLKGTKADFITSLVDKAATQLESDKIYIEKLLHETAEGEIGPFLSSIREWLRRAWKNYIENISKIIDIKYIYPDDIATWFEKSTITNMKPLSLKKLQCWCLGLEAKELAIAQPVLVENVLAKLHQVGFVYSPSYHGM
ncbi:translin-associated factor X-interacting protein 1-like isoform X2 [Octopus sinensis]|nr:translin-associated factor X-interacting protein 1-like isoform X2 [Octopus sinensis]